MIFKRTKLPKSEKKANPAELYNLDPKTAQKLHELCKGIPLYFEPFEILQSEGEKQNV